MERVGPCAASVWVGGSTGKRGNGLPANTLGPRARVEFSFFFNSIFFP
jgi:hypothetical protein